MSSLLREVYARSLEQEARDKFYLNQKYRISKGEWERCQDALKRFAADLAQKRKDERKKAV